MELCAIEASAEALRRKRSQAAESALHDLTPPTTISAKQEASADIDRYRSI